MKKKREFVKLSLFLIGKKDHNKNMAEKQSPQAESMRKLSPEESADKIVKTRKAMKRKDMPVKPSKLYDEL